MTASRRMEIVLKVVFAVVVAVALFLAASGVYLYQLSTTLPDFADGPEAFRTAQTSVVYAADGSVLARWHAGEDRTVVPLESMAESLRDAVVSTQDPYFFEHHGVNIDAILAAIGLGGSSADDSTQAFVGSTITQQVVKMLFPEERRTLVRKAQEVLLAYELSVRVEKTDVLAMYLNTVYFGHGAYGVEAASRRFFGVPASELTLSQSAVLAGLIDSPARYSPINEPEAALRQRNRILSAMERLGYISADAKSAASDETITLAPQVNAPSVAPYFVEHVKRTLIDEIGEDQVFTGGLRVHTTLDPSIQREAETAARSLLGASSDPEYAIVAIEHSTGRVLAMVGGRDFAQNQFNLATQGRRQPGSAFKTFVLAEALERGVSPDQIFDATPYTVQVTDGTWVVNNYENEATAPRVSFRAATNWSINAVYARLIMNMGAESVVDMARRTGITSPLEANPAIALGGLEIGVSPLEMTSAYGTFANGGTRMPVVVVSKVTDSEGNLVWESTASPERALEESVARLTSSMLRGTVEDGTGVAANIPGVWVAGKTGTTQSYRDAWFVGFTDKIVCGVWVGHREGQIDMTNVRGAPVSGGSFPAQIWNRFVSRAILVHGKPPAASQGSGVATSEGSESVPATEAAAALKPVTICPQSARIAVAGCPDPQEIYLKAEDIPSGVCTVH